MRQSVKARVDEEMLFHIEDDVKGCLSDLRGLEGLNMSIVSSCLKIPFILAR